MDQLVSPQDSSFVVEKELIIVASILILALTIPLCTKGCSKKRKRDHQSAEVGSDGLRSTVTSKMVDADGSCDLVNGRLAGHDRALPEIPPASSGITSTDDDEEEDEGHYDIISKSKKSSQSKDLITSSAAAAAAAAQSAAVKKSQAHPYEKVRGDPDSDSTYAGIRDNTTTKITGYSRDQTLIADPLYAGIGDVESEAGGSALYSAVGSHRVRSTHCLPLRVSISENEGSPNTIGALGGAVFSVPPIPEKIDGAGEESGIDGFLVGANPVGNSPLLPPRNGDAANGNGLWNNNNVGASNGASTNARLFHLQPSAAAWNAGTFPVTIYNGVVQPDASNGDGGGASGPQSSTNLTANRRVPDYSSVTARESLENLRKRQQLTSRQTPAFVDLLDGTYDMINYDQIKIPQNSASRRESEAVAPLPAPVPDNVYNTGSDLYAEIGTGPNSTRSSTYARVTEISILDSSGAAADHVPLPPSVDTLQQLTHGIIDDLGDPGYSLVDSNRLRDGSPHGAVASNISVVPLQSGRHSPVYAVVTKAQKFNPSRRTIHVDDDVERGMAGRSHLVENGDVKKGFGSRSHVAENNDVDRRVAGRSCLGVNDLYSKVTKPKQRPTSSADGGFVATSNGHEPVVESVAFGGARSKVRSNGQVIPGQDLTNFGTEPGYASIDNLLPGVSSNGADPDYDTVGDLSATDGASDYDPSYETVAVTRVDQTAMVRSMPGVAQEISPTSNDAMHVDHPLNLQHWHQPRREHIYEVVKETSRRSGSTTNWKSGGATGGRLGGATSSSLFSKSRHTTDL